MSYVDQQATQYIIQHNLPVRSVCSLYFVRDHRTLTSIFSIECFA